MSQSQLKEAPVRPVDLERRLIALEAEIRFSENRVRRDIMERDRAWRELVMTAMLPPAALERQPVNVDQYHAYAPEKLELIDGYLLYGPDHPEARRRLLNLLLVNVGLLEAVKLVPAKRWREALDRA